LELPETQVIIYGGEGEMPHNQYELENLLFQRPLAHQCLLSFSLVKDKVISSIPYMIYMEEIISRNHVLGVE
jgi:hypothetical protein